MPAISQAGQYLHCIAPTLCTMLLPSSSFLLVNDKAHISHRKNAHTSSVHVIILVPLLRAVDETSCNSILCAIMGPNKQWLCCGHVVQTGQPFWLLFTS